MISESRKSNYCNKCSQLYMPKKYFTALKYRSDESGGGQARASPRQRALFRHQLSRFVSVFNATEFCHFFVSSIFRSQASERRRGLLTSRCERRTHLSGPASDLSRPSLAEDLRRSIVAPRVTQNTYLIVALKEARTNTKQTRFVKTAENSKLNFFGNLFHSPDLAA